LLQAYAVAGDKALDAAARCGSRRPNAWGLFDMHGNVWEWCWDLFDVYGSESVIQDPVGAGDGFLRVLRGGSFFSLAQSLRSDCRDACRPNERINVQGFRVARTCR
jgi:formylglycine-generating enzyme required for sulfatase activity